MIGITRMRVSHSSSVVDDIHECLFGTSLRYPVLDSTSQDRTVDIICPEEDDDSAILSHWT